MDSKIGTKKAQERADIDELLRMPLAELIERSNAVRKEYIGEDLELCGIINAKSGACSEDCKFCAQSSYHNAKAQAYPLKGTDEIVGQARQVKALGAVNFGIVTSGNRLNAEELDTISCAITRIRKEIGIKACASLGALTRDELGRLKEAGLERYHHNIETSPNFYPKIVTTHSFDERTSTIRSARSLGLEVCSGGILGMGEGWQDRIDMAYILRELDVDSIPLNLLVPIEGTPLEAQAQLSCNDAIRAIAIFRIILKDKVIKIAAGRETVLKDFQGMGFMAGANGMLIGGYLTIKGRDAALDQRLVQEIKRLWSD